MNIWAKRGLFPCFIFISCFWISCLLGGCNSSAVGSSMDEIDRLNGLAFKFWYKDLDSVAYYAACAERKSHACSYMDGLATAYLNRSFIAFERMDYLESVRLAELVLSMGRSQILLLRTDVLMMRLCVRTAHIESFFFYRNSAQKRMARILEDYALLKETDRADFHIARVGFHLASAAYYDTQGLTKGALDEMACIEREQLEGDTALQLAMLYVHGQIGYESDIHGQESVLRRFDDLFRRMVIKNLRGLVLERYRSFWFIRLLLIWSVVSVLVGGIIYMASLWVGMKVVLVMKSIWPKLWDVKLLNVLNLMGMYMVCFRLV